MSKITVQHITVFYVDGVEFHRVDFKPKAPSDTFEKLVALVIRYERGEISLEDLHTQGVALDAHGQINWTPHNKGQAGGGLVTADWSFQWRYARPPATGVWIGTRRDGTRFRVKVSAADGSIRSITRLSEPRWITVGLDSDVGRRVAQALKGWHGRVGP